MSRQITDFFSAEKIPTNETEMDASVFSETLSEEIFQHDDDDITKNSLAAIPIPDKKRGKAAMISPLRMPDHSRQILGDPNVPQTPTPTVQFQQHPLKSNMDPRLNKPYMPQTTIISDDENEPTLSDKQRGKKRSLDQAAGDYLGPLIPNHDGQQHQGAGTATAAAAATGTAAAVVDLNNDNDNVDELFKQNQQMIVEAQNKVKQQNSRKKKPKDEEEQKEDVIRKKKRAVFQALSELNEAWPEAKLRVTIDIPK